MRTALALTLALTLGACATTQPTPPALEPVVVIKIERIVTPIPSTLLDLPDQVPALPIDVVKTDDKAVAKWMLDSEERTLALEAQVRQIRNLYIQNLRNARVANLKEGVVNPPEVAAALPASQAAN